MQKYLLTLTLTGPTRHKPVLDPLAVQRIENQLLIINWLTLLRKISYYISLWIVTVWAQHLIVLFFNVWI